MLMLTPATSASIEDIFLIDASRGRTVRPSHVSSVGSSGKRSVDCCRLAEAASEPKMKVYPMRLALSWMQAATSADERVLEKA
jgi:hypothetical protein